MQKFDGSKFKFAEIFNNSDGKTSASGFIGVILGLVAAVSFLAGMVGWFMDKNNVIDVMEQIIILVGSVTLLLGARKFAPTRRDGTTIVDIEANKEEKSKEEVKKEELKIDNSNIEKG